MAGHHHDHDHHGHHHGKGAAAGGAEGHLHQMCSHAADRGYFLGESHDRNARRTMFVLILCAVTMVAEIGAGLLFGSMALLADGLHMATHAGVMLVAVIAYQFARRKRADPQFSFSTGKLGDLAAYSSALALAATASLMGYESIRRLFEPVAISFDEAIPVAFLGLAVNIISVWLLHDGHHHHGHGHDHGHHHDHAHDHHDHDHAHKHGEGGHGAKDHDLNLRAAYLHVVADLGLGVLAIAGLFAARGLGWYWLDPLLGLLAAVVILRWAVSLLKAAGATLLDKVPNAEMANTIRHKLEKVGGQVTDLHLWRIGTGHYALIASVSGAVAELAAYKAAVGDVGELAHITIELDGSKV